MAVPSLVSISNDALGEIREQPIQSMDEGSRQADECSRVYPQVLEEMLEGHSWSFANIRATLAPLANDRPGEWSFAYAMPQQVGRVMRIIPLASGVSPFTIGAWVDGWPNRYVIEANVLYTWLPNAVLEYVLADIDPSLMTALFRRALSLAMAGRLAISLRESPALQKSNEDRAAVALSRAMADDMNRQPQSPAMGDVGSVRQGGSIYGNWTPSYLNGALPVADTGY